MKNTANTNFLVWQDQLFGLMEIALPTGIDPGTLATLGATDLAGVVPSVMSAHPRPVRSRGSTFTFGVRYDLHTYLDLFELPAEGPVRRFGAVKLDAPVMLHDFVATEHHLVFFVSPVVVQVWRAVLGLRSFEKLFRWEPERGVEVIVVPLDAPDAPVRFRTDAFFQWHFVGARERGDEIVVDLVSYPDFSSFDTIGHDGLGYGLVHRAVVDAPRRSLRIEPLWAERCEFPRIDPRLEGGGRYRHAWVMARGSGHNAVARVDLDRGQGRFFELPEHQRASEPVFVPRAPGAAEDDGWVLVLVYDAHEDASFVAVFDAVRLEDGPVARAWLDHHVPMTFHGAFLAGT